MKKMKWTMVLIVASAFIWGAFPPGIHPEDTPSTETLSLQAEEPAIEDTGEGLRFNFRGAPLDTVLDYMSRAAGFIIIRETDVSGRVDVVSHQPVSEDEAVELLNTILNKEGYAAIRNGRILTIVKRDEAAKRNIPVKSGRDPMGIPPTDEMVTQILPVRYANATKLLDNIKPMLPSYAIISANESSNAIILTDTQSHIRRMAEIIRALDTSISDISTIRVFMLRYADATDTAKIINELFKVPTSSQERSRDFRPPFFDRGRENRDDSSSSRANSEALQASSRVVAVADENTNSVVISAPEEIMPTIEKLVSEIDVTSEDITEVRVFPLKYADAQEMTDIITNIFRDRNTTAQARSSSGRSGFFSRFTQQNQQQVSQRDREENTVLVRPDTRTNSVVVSASSNVMPQVAEVIRQLDANPAREKKVHVYSLKNADAATVTDLLKQLFPEQTQQSTRTRSNTTNRNTGTNTRNTGTNTRNTNTSTQRQR